MASVAGPGCDAPGLGFPFWQHVPASPSPLAPPASPPLTAQTPDARGAGQARGRGPRPQPAPSLPDGLASFQRFLRSEFSEENLDFWLACEDYRKTESPAQMAAKARQIYEEFIRSEAPKEVGPGPAGGRACGLLARALAGRDVSGAGSQHVRPRLSPQGERAAAPWDLWARVTARLRPPSRAQRDRASRSRPPPASVGDARAQAAQAGAS